MTILLLIFGLIHILIFGEKVGRGKGVTYIKIVVSFTFIDFLKIRSGSPLYA